MAISVARLKSDRRFGVDSHWSWVTAGFLSWVLFMTTMSQQCMGVLFYGIVHDYGINRGQAAWPLVFFGTSTSLAGPAMGYFCKRFSCKAVIITCSVTAAVSLGACCLTNNKWLLTFLFGFVQGVARSGNLIAVKVLASEHFERLRATACSVISFFAGLNMILAPPLAELFHSTYGIRGTFLLLGGLTLNTCPAVIVLQRPCWLKSALGPEELLTVKDVQIVSNENPPLRDDLNDEIADQESGSVVNKLQSVDTNKTSFLQTSTRAIGSVGLHTQCSKLVGQSDERKRTIALFAKLFLTLPFALHALTFIVIIFGMATFLLLSVDIAKDRGVPPSSAVFLMAAFAAGDLTLMPLSGLVIDAGLLSLESVMFLGFFLEAIAFELFVWLRTFPMMLVCSVLIGASNGSTISLQVPALIKDFGIDPLPLLVGAVFFCNGVALLTRPALVIAATPLDHMTCCFIWCFFQALSYVLHGWLSI
ncbi:monocarboxylate transporter 3-like isoform X5 [Amblyomma americanum]